MKFTATLQLDGKTATGIRVPDDIVAALGRGNRPQVRVTLRDFSYTTTVGRMRGEFKIPALSYSNRKRHVLAVDGAKTEETRSRRIAQIVSELS